MGDATIFWSNIFRVLKHQGRSVEFLAQRLKVSHTALYRWRDGSRVAPESQMHAASDILGVPMALLFLPTDLPSGRESVADGSKEAVTV